MGTAIIDSYLVVGHCPWFFCPFFNTVLLHCKPIYSADTCWLLLSLMLLQPVLAEDWAGSRLWQAGSGDQRVVHQDRIGWSGYPGLVPVLVPSDTDDITNKKDVLHWISMQWMWKTFYHANVSEIKFDQWLKFIPWDGYPDRYQIWYSFKKPHSVH